MMHHHQPRALNPVTFTISLKDMKTHEEDNSHDKRLSLWKVFHDDAAYEIGTRYRFLMLSQAVTVSYFKIKGRYTVIVKYR